MTSENRRVLLQGLVVSLPSLWSRPVVESVMLPAHAQQSQPPPISTSELCNLVLCGGGPAFTAVPITNISPDELTLLNVIFSNSNHSVAEPALPLSIDPGECINLIVTDVGNSCGNEIDPGVATLYFDGFAPYEVNIPILMSGP